MNNRQKLVQQQFLNNEKEVLNHLKQNYGEALKGVNDKIAKLQLDIDGLNDAWAEFDGTAEEKQVLLSRIQSKIYQKQYQQAIQGQIDDVLKDLQNNAYESISEYLEKSYEDGFVGTMFDLQGQGIPLVMPLDEQAMVRAVQLDSKISKGLYSGIGEDVADLKKRITMEVSRGLAMGSSYVAVARCIKGHMVGAYTKKTGGALYRAEVIARTEGHRVQVQATMDACYGARDKGADVVKQWDSTLDARTRDSHIKVDGEIRELDEKFSNNLMFPGDPNGGAKEVINCRCALLQRARWAVGGGFTKYDNFSKELKQFENVETYNEFKKAYFSKENRAYMKYVEELEDQYGTKDFQKLLSALDDDEYKRFVKLQDARPVFSGMYRGDDVVKKTLENSVNSDIIISEKQFGTKVGKHAIDFGLDASLESDRQKIREIIDDIVTNHDEVRTGNWRGQTEPIDFYIKGEDVVLVSSKSKQFVTILKGGVTNERVKNAGKQ
jgi:hypothetical protein